MHILRESVFDELVRVATLGFHLLIAPIALADAEKGEYITKQELPSQASQPQ